MDPVGQLNCNMHDLWTHWEPQKPSPLLKKQENFLRSRGNHLGRLLKKVTETGFAGGM